MIERRNKSLKRSGMTGRMIAAKQQQHQLATSSSSSSSTTVASDAAASLAYYPRNTLSHVLIYDDQQSPTPTVGWLVGWLVRLGICVPFAWMPPYGWQLRQAAVVLGEGPRRVTWKSIITWYFEQSVKECHVEVLCGKGWGSIWFWKEYEEFVVGD